MNDLVPVSLEGLSGLTHTIALAPHQKFEPPEFVSVSFVGKYRDGSLGRDDARYISAVLAAVDRAWFWQALILDLAQLHYRWGDDLTCIFHLGTLSWSQCDRPLAIVVGDECRGALKTLAPGSYEIYCVESHQEAVGLIRKQRPEYERCMERYCTAQKGS